MSRYRNIVVAALSILDALLLVVVVMQLTTARADTLIPWPQLNKQFVQNEATVTLAAACAPNLAVAISRADGCAYKCASGVWALLICGGPAGPTGPTGPAGANGSNGSNGADGSDGADGQNVTCISESAGANCTYGGIKCTSVSGVAYVCTGAPGSNGTNGTNGTNGANGTNGTNGTNGDPGLDGTSVACSSEAPGVHCAAGGVACVSSTGTVYVCNGADGDPGLDGSPGDPGIDGSDGAPGAPGANGLNCWDLDGDGTMDAAEDTNSDSTWDAVDCKGDPGADGSPGDPGADSTVAGPAGPQGNPTTLAGDSGTAAGATVTIAGGAGIDVTGDGTSTLTIKTDSTEAGFISSSEASCSGLDGGMSLYGGVLHWCYDGSPIYSPGGYSNGAAALAANVQCDPDGDGTYTSGYVQYSDQRCPTVDAQIPIADYQTDAVSNIKWVTLSGDIQMDLNGTATIQSNSVALGTDSTGNYIATLAPESGTVTSAESKALTLNGTAPIDVTGDGTSGIAVSIADAVADGTTKGVATFTAADFDSDGSGRISIDDATWAKDATTPLAVADSFDYDQDGTAETGKVIDPGDGYGMAGGNPFTSRVTFYEDFLEQPPKVFYS